jgi:hypothetical protein
MSEPKEKATPIKRFPVGRCKGCGKELDGKFKELADGETIVFCSYECYCND